MDVSFYIGELLQLKGKVSVPGLGYFFYQQKSAYYNEKEGKFYPPHNQVKFEPQLIDDDLALTQYIAGKNDITLPSSQYFTEKYITTAKQQALTKEVPIAHLGWLVTVHGQISFKEGGHFNTDPGFFGFKPVEINRIGYATFTEDNNHDVAPALETEVEGPATQQGQAVGPGTEGPPVIWFVLLATILALAIAAIIIFKFFPSVFSKITGRAPVEQTVAPKSTIVPIIPPLKPNAGKTDSVPANADSSAATVNSASTSHWELVTKTTLTTAAAYAKIKRLKAEGLKATIALDIPGKLFHVALVDTFKTFKQADSVRRSLIDLKKIAENTSQTPEIKP